MIKVLLADDEPLCLIGMQSMIDWNGLGYEVVAAVRNGADAWNAIQEQSPDIVITDLIMPVMGGLELAEKCREVDNALPVFIMLTNYEEFDYAKRSLRLGAVEYLVKIDLTAENLLAALQKAKTQVQKEHILRSPEGYAPPADPKQHRELFYTRLYGGLYSGMEDFSSQCAKLGLHFDAPCYAVCFAVLKDSGHDIALSSVTKMATDILTKYLPDSVVTEMDLSHFAVLIPLENPETGHLDEILKKTGEILFRYFNVRIQWAVGHAVQDILEIKDSLQEASTLLAQMEPSETVRICRPAPTQPTGYRAKLTARIQDYISKNLSSRLSLNDVASEFGFSPNYLSQLLSRNGEAGFVEFVTATRIRSAKTLMETTDLKIYEISDKVGFESASYFSKVFKKLEGISPKEYMQRLRGQEPGKEDLR